MHRILKIKKNVRKKWGREREKGQRKEGWREELQRQLQGRSPETLPLTLFCIYVFIGELLHNLPETHNLPDAFHHMQIKNWSHMTPTPLQLKQFCIFTNAEPSCEFPFIYSKLTTFPVLSLDSNSFHLLKEIAIANWTKKMEPSHCAVDSN